MQKKRELSAAGIELKPYKKMRGTDYSEEIPFARDAPDFAFKTDASELPKPNVDISNITMHMIEGKNKLEEERGRRKMDANKQKKMKEKDF